MRLDSVRRRRSGAGRSARVSAAAIYVAMSALGCGAGAAEQSQPVEPAVAAQQPDQASDAPSTFAAELQRRERQISELEDRVANARADDWLERSQLAMAHLERARLSGDFRDYARAVDTMKRAEALAPEGGGPLLAAASLALAVHDLDGAEQRLERWETRPLSTPQDRARAALVRVDLRRARGELGAALSELDALQRAPSSLQHAIGVRRALVLADLGELERAEAQLETLASTAERLDRRSRAWLHLQLGLLDLEAGALQPALAHYLDAEAELGGWWLVGEHAAEALAALGHESLARSIYRQNLAATRDPAVFEALAALESDPARVEELHLRAQQLQVERTRRLPLAASGHALDAQLARFESEDPDAESNFDGQLDALAREVEGLALDSPSVENRVRWLEFALMRRDLESAEAAEKWLDETHSHRPRVLAAKADLVELRASPGLALARRDEGNTR